jgi:hypothetical protein
MHRIALRLLPGAVGAAIAMTVGVARGHAQERPDSGVAHHHTEMYHDSASTESEPRLGHLVFATSASTVALRTMEEKR